MGKNNKNSDGVSKSVDQLIAESEKVIAELNQLSVAEDLKQEFDNDDLDVMDDDIVDQNEAAIIKANGPRQLISDIENLLKEEISDDEYEKIKSSNELVDYDPEDAEHQKLMRELDEALIKANGPKQIISDGKALLKEMDREELEDIDYAEAKIKQLFNKYLFNGNVIDRDLLAIIASNPNALAILLECEELYIKKSKNKKLALEKVNKLHADVMEAIEEVGKENDFDKLFTEKDNARLAGRFKKELNDVIEGIEARRKVGEPVKQDAARGLITAEKLRENVQKDTLDVLIESIKFKGSKDEKIQYLASALNILLEQRKPVNEGRVYTAAIKVLQQIKHTSAQENKIEQALKKETKLQDQVLNRSGDVGRNK
jgi:hypothetical protein